MIIGEGNACMITYEMLDNQTWHLVTYCCNDKLSLVLCLFPIESVGYNVITEKDTGNNRSELNLSIRILMLDGIYYQLFCCMQTLNQFKANS